jgi:hypothetical protein
MLDLQAATAFLDTHARLLDRHRLVAILGGPPDGALAALAAYRNWDGGFGWGLEPDLRPERSQPAGALHAFEVLDEVGPHTSPMGRALCDWLAAVSLADGGLPFALAGADAPGSSPVWAQADTTTSSLHITSAVCAYAHRAARHDPAVARHPWLATATGFCLGRVSAIDEPSGAYELRFALDFLDTVADGEPQAAQQLERLARFVPASGELAVAGGQPDEKLRPLDLAPRPGRPVRRLLSDEVVERDLDRLEAEQGDDGGWDIDFQADSPAARLEWRGYVTVRAIHLLRLNGRFPDRR